MALQVTHSILAKLPDDVSTLLIQGEADAQLGNTAEAEDAFTHVLRIESDSVPAQIGLGRLRLPMDPAAAATLFQNATKQEPLNLSAWNNLGIARDLLEQHREAQEAYRKAQAIDPTNIATQTNLALSLAMTGNGAEAVELIAPLAASPSATPRIRHDYAVVLAMAGREAEARQMLAHDLTPDQVKQVLDAARQQRAGGS